MPRLVLEDALLKAAYHLHETVSLDLTRPENVRRATKLSRRVTGILAQMTRGKPVDISVVGGYDLRAAQTSEAGDVIFVRGRRRKRPSGGNKLRERS